MKTLPKNGRWSQVTICEKYILWIWKSTIEKSEGISCWFSPKLYFTNMKPSMSVRCWPNEKQLIILGQDESCFKQFSISKRCWVSPDGEMKLLPKTGGYNAIVSVRRIKCYYFIVHVTSKVRYSVKCRTQDSNPWPYYGQDSVRFFSPYKPTCM